MGDTIGDYRLIDSIGEGAAGEVFLATPLKDKPFARSGDFVAIKRYKPAILKQVHQFERIEREFTVGSQLSHPNLVRIFEYAESGRDKAPYLVMEHVDGVPLDRWIDQYFPLPRGLLLRFVDQLLSGVSHLHENEIQHRDLKPANIMVTSTLDLKIMDFGVVHVQKDSPITPDDKFLGTIRNSSPEMLFGGSYDHRTDLYSLGTVFYALLNGEEVYAEEKQFARLVQLIDRGSLRFGASNQSNEVASRLLEVTQRLLKKNPDERHASASDVRHEVELLRSSFGEIDEFTALHGYIATALTGLDDDSREAIMFVSSRISEIAKDYGVYVYQPRKATDPFVHKDVDAAAVYKIDHNRVTSADLLFIIANRPSFGVGQEIEIATGRSIPTILITREGTVISRMVTGSPANILDRIEYATPEDLDRKLRKSITQNLDRVRRWRNLVRVPHSVNIGNRLAESRANCGFASASEFAESLGVSVTLLDAIERQEYDAVSLQLLDRVAASLGISLSELTANESLQMTPAKPSVDVNLKRLEGVAKKLNWNAATYFELRDDYGRQFAASGESATISEDQWRARHNMLDERRLKESNPTTRRPTGLFPDDIET